MVRVWYMDDLENDQREEHHLEPPKYLTLDELRQVSGVEYLKIDVDNVENEGKLSKIRKERRYNYEDQVNISRDKLPNYEEKLKIFYEEHIHADEEVRLFLDGSGYLDVRDKADQWIRINAVKGDMLILPAGIYHRFTLDKSDYARVKRMFSGDPVWTAINRPAEEHPSRQQYLSRIARNFLA